MKKHTIINLDEVNFDNLLSKLSNKNSGHHVNLSSGTKRIKKTRSKPIKLGSSKSIRAKGCPMCSSSKCRNCGCGRNKPTKKIIAVYKRPHNGKIVGKVISNKRTQVNRPSSNRPSSNRPSNRPSSNIARTRRAVRSIINKILSRKSHTRSNSLASMIEKIHMRELNKPEHPRHSIHSKPSRCSRKKGFFSRF